MAIILTIYAVSFFALGLSVAVRASPHPDSPTRRRLLALSAFGLLHAGFEWYVIAGEHFLRGSLPAAALALSASSFLALLLFGFGWRGRDRLVGLGLAGALAAGWCAVYFASDNLVALEVYTRVLMGFPAALIGADALLRGVGLTSSSSVGRRARLSAVAALAVYAVLQLFSSPGDFFPASVLNTSNFEAWFGVPCMSVRTVSVVILTAAICSLLDQFDIQMRSGLEEGARRLTQELAITATQLKEAQRIGNIGSWEWDIATGAVAMSEQLYRILRLDPAQFAATYESVIARVHSEDRGAVESSLQRSLAFGTPFSVDCRIVLPDESVCWIHAQGEVEFDASAKPARMVGTAQDITDRLKLETATQWERHLRQHVLDNILAGVVVYGLDGRVIEANRIAVESTGLSRDQIIGRAAADTLWWSGSTELKAAIEGALARAAKGERVRGDYRIGTASGNSVTADVEFAPLHDREGAIRGIVSSGVDVSARQRAKEKLALGEARLRAILDSGPECIKTLDSNCHLLDMNRAGLAMIEVDSLDDVRGQNVLGILDPDYRQEYREGVERVFRGERVQQRYEIVGLKGTRRCLEQSAVPLFDPAGKVDAMLAVTRDVTERVQAEEALRENREMLAGVLSISPEAAIIADQDLRILVFSQGASRIFGYRPEEVIGRSVTVLIPERFHEMHGRAVAGFAAAVAGSKDMSDRMELIGLRKSGEEFPAEASLSKLLTTKGLIYTVILRDISRRKAANEELLRAKQQAEAASEAKSRFVANMSHELRTPLNAIIGFSELIARQTFGPIGDARYGEYARDVQKSGRHLLALINDILDISRIEAGRIELREEEPIDVSELVDHCMRSVSGRARDLGVSLHSEIAEDVPALRGDPRLLTQILLNLTSNALKFTPSGGRIVLSVNLEARGGVEIAVTDTGIGMSPEEVARLGEPFVQFEMGPGGKAEGAGLGISIAKRLAELHGGSLRIESAPGKGTRIALCLPPERSVACAILQAVGS